MNLLEKDLKLLLDTLADRCTAEALRTIMETMEQSMDDGGASPGRGGEILHPPPGAADGIDCFPAGPLRWIVCWKWRR